MNPRRERRLRSAKTEHGCPVWLFIWRIVWTRIIPALGLALAAACISLCRSLREWGNRPS